MTETETWSLIPALHEYRTWALRNTPEDERDDRFTMLIALVRPDGKIITAMPGWQGSDEGDDEEVFRREIHVWLDVVLEKRRLDEEI